MTIISYILSIWIISANIVKKTFIDKNTLMKHMMTQTGRKQYQCYICDKICLNISSLKLHMMMHTVDNSYKYSFCEIAFLHTSAIKIHMKVHLELKQYQCNSSDNNTDLTYTGNKVYLKSQCEKKLKSTTGNNYQIHFNNLFIELKLPL